MTEEQRLVEVENILHTWACEEIDNTKCKSLCYDLGFEIDLRQSALDATMWLYDRRHNDNVLVEI